MEVLGRKVTATEVMTTGLMKRVEEGKKRGKERRKRSKSAGGETEKKNEENGERQSKV